MLYVLQFGKKHIQEYILLKSVIRGLHYPQS